jgi:hypothetical protein
MVSVDEAADRTPVTPAPALSLLSPEPDVDGAAPGEDVLDVLRREPERISASAVVLIILGAVFPLLGLLVLGWDGRTVLVALWCEGWVVIAASCVRAAVLGIAGHRAWGSAVMARVTYGVALLGMAGIVMVMVVPGWPMGEHGTLLADFVRHVDWPQVQALVVLAGARYAVWVAIGLLSVDGGRDGADAHDLDRSAAVLVAALFLGLFLVSLTLIAAGVEGDLATRALAAVVLLRAVIEIAWSRSPSALSRVRRGADAGSQLRR